MSHFRLKSMGTLAHVYIIILTFTELQAMSSTRDSSPADTALLGNDFIFFTAFLTAFLFNWIGFLLLMCFCHTIAAR